LNAEKHIERKTAPLLILPLCIRPGGSKDDEISISQLKCKAAFLFIANIIYVRAPKLTG